MIDSRKFALGILTVVATAAVAAACGGKKSSSTPPPASVVTRGNGSAADFSCAGHFTDPASTNTTVGVHVQTVDQALNGTTPNLPGVRVAEVDLATVSTSGNVAVSGSNAIANLTAKDNTRVHYLGTVSAHVPTYSFNFITGAVGNTSGSLVLRVIPTTIYTAFISLLNIPPSEVAGKVQVAGAVGDCTDQGAQVAHATVEVTGGHLCRDSATAPCIAYIANGTPNTNATETDSEGAFIVAGLPPNTQTTVKIFGITTAGQPAVQIGQLIVNGQPDTIALGSSTPP